MFPRLFTFVVLLIPALMSAQSPDSVLATAKGKNFTKTVLSPDGQKSFADQKVEIESTRNNLLAQMIAEALLDLEAKATASAPKRLIDAARAKVPEPPATQIQAVYDANRSALGNRSLDEVRK